MNGMQVQQEQNYNSSGVMFNNQSTLENQSFMQLRLDMQQIIKKIEEFLSSETCYVMVTGDGEYIEKREQVGQPLANKEGIQRIMKIIYMRINHHVVQGNFDNDHYLRFLEKNRKELTLEIVSKCYDWGIDESDLDLIIDTIMSFIEPFISRLIGNKERESYMSQFQSRELVQQQPQKNGLFNFAGGIGR